MPFCLSLLTFSYPIVSVLFIMGMFYSFRFFDRVNFFFAGGGGGGGRGACVLKRFFSTEVGKFFAAL